MTSIRLLRKNQELKKDITLILQNIITQNQLFGGYVPFISSVELSRDLRIGSVGIVFTEWNGDTKEALRILRTHVPAMRKKLASVSHSKCVPDLRFFLCQKAEKEEKMRELFKIVKIDCEREQQ